MNIIISRFLLVCLCGALVESYDEVDLQVESNALMKILRDMVNQTKADTLNLPANATSIRENITDTFSCENKTFGYYADVDNECQVFHVCLPTQTPSGRAVTFRYSFICPEETLFNQAVLVCTRPIDAIDCEDSPLFYHLNDEIGKVSNKTEEKTDEPKNEEAPQNPPPQKQEEVKKQNLIIENLIKGVVNDELREKLQAFAQQHTGLIPDILPDSFSRNVYDANDEDDDTTDADSDDDAEGRIALERSVGRRGRGSFRFLADV